MSIDRRLAKCLFLTACSLSSLAIAGCGQTAQGPLASGWCWKELDLRGLRTKEVQDRLGVPSKVLREGFLHPTNGGPTSPSGPQMPSGVDEQWIYPGRLQHTYVYFHDSHVLSALEEWSDY